MANEFRYGLDQNGVRHPVCDDNRVDWESYAKTGVHNLDMSFNSQTQQGASIEDTATGHRIVMASANTYGAGFLWYKNLKKNTNYRIHTNVSITSGVARIVVLGTNDTFANKVEITASTTLTTSGALDVSFNTGNYNYILLQLNASQATSVQGDVTYGDFIIALAEDTYNGYSEGVMTNKELTDAQTYKVGDTINVNHVSCAAHLTSGSKDIVVFLPLNKKTQGVTGFTLPSNAQFIARANQVYLIQDGAVTNYTISDVVVNDLGMQFVVKKSDTTAFTDQFNNVPVTFVIHGGPMTLT